MKTSEKPAFLSRLLTSSVLAASCLTANVFAAPAETEWTELFDGESLQGWTRLGGSAPYRVDEGTIVGTSVLNSPNTFLTSDEQYQDFILEFEVKVDTGLNSGVQFRSRSEDDYMNGRVHGTQFELDTASRAWSAGIYDEARRGWLYPVDLNPEARSLFRLDEWNTARIECLGEMTRTFLNGEPVSYLIDQAEFVREGFIGLQVHSISSKSGHEGKEIRWRNIRIAPATPENITQDVPDFFIQNLNVNEVSDVEAEQGWKLLFDGESIEAFSDTLPETWSIANETLTVNAKESKVVGTRDLVSNEAFAAFDLSLEFKLSEAANSGIKYFVSDHTDTETGKTARVGLEYQLLDNDKHPDAKNGKDGNRTCASLYDLYPSAKKIHNRGVKASIGDWNRARIVAMADGTVQHWLNGYKVLEFNRLDSHFAKDVAESKYKSFEDFGQIDAGHILLQDHSDTVSFRSVKLRKL